MTDSQLRLAEVISYLDTVTEKAEQLVKALGGPSSDTQAQLERVARILDLDETALLHVAESLLSPLSSTDDPQERDARIRVMLEVATGELPVDSETGKLQLQQQFSELSRQVAEQQGELETVREELQRLRSGAEEHQDQLQ